MIVPWFLFWLSFKLVGSYCAVEASDDCWELGRAMQARCMCLEAWWWMKMVQTACRKGFWTTVMCFHLLFKSVRTYCAFEASDDGWKLGLAMRARRGCHEAWWWMKMVRSAWRKGCWNTVIGPWWHPKMMIAVTTRRSWGVRRHHRRRDAAAAARTG